MGQGMRNMSSRVAVLAGQENGYIFRFGMFGKVLVGSVKRLGIEVQG